LQGEAAGWKPANSPPWNYPIDYWCLEVLQRRWDYKRSYVWLFPSNQYDRASNALGVGALGRIFDSAKRDGILPPEATPYSLRYTRATYSELMFGNSLLVQRMLNHASDWSKGQSIQGSRLKATPGYVKTLTDHVRPHVNTYASTLRQLCGHEPMSEQTRRVFLENEALTIYERHAYAIDTGLHAHQVQDAMDKAG
jgi:hypothetical protein